MSLAQSSGSKKRTSASSVGPASGQHQRKSAKSTLAINQRQPQQQHQNQVPQQQQQQLQQPLQQDASRSRLTEGRSRRNQISVKQRAGKVALAGPGNGTGSNQAPWQSAVEQHGGEPLAPISSDTILPLEQEASEELDYYRRQSHCEIEKRRRDKMNYYMLLLASLVPPCNTNNGSKIDKLTVLRMAVSHVRSLRSSLCSFSSFHLRPSFLSSGNLLKNLILQMASHEAPNNLLMIVTCDRGKVVFVSQSSREILNQNKEELVGQCLFDLVHKDDLLKVKEQISYFEPQPREMLVDSKTLQPVKNQLLGSARSSRQLSFSQADSSTPQPGARRSFFCRIKSGRASATATGGCNTTNHQALSTRPELHKSRRNAAEEVEPEAESEEHDGRISIGVEAPADLEASALVTRASAAAADPEVAEAGGEAEREHSSPTRGANPAHKGNKAGSSSCSSASPRTSPSSCGGEFSSSPPLSSSIDSSSPEARAPNTDSQQKRANSRSASTESSDACAQVDAEVDSEPDAKVNTLAQAKSGADQTEQGTNLFGSSNSEASIEPTASADSRTTETKGASAASGAALMRVALPEGQSRTSRAQQRQSQSSRSRRYIVMHCTGYLKSIRLTDDDELDYESDLDLGGGGGGGGSRSGASSRTANDNITGDDAGSSDDEATGADEEEQRDRGGAHSRTVTCLVAVCRRSPVDLSVRADQPLTFTCRYSMEGKFVFVDQRTTIALGYTPQQLLGTSHYAYCYKDSVSTFKECHRQSIVKSESVSSDVYQFKRANGQTLWLQTSLKCFRNPWTRLIDYIVANHTTAEGCERNYNEGCVPTKFNQDVTGGLQSSSSGGSQSCSPASSSGISLDSKKSSSPSSSSNASSHSMDSCASNGSVRALLNHIDRLKSGGGLRHAGLSLNKRRSIEVHSSSSSSSRHPHHHSHHHHHNLARSSCSSTRKTSEDSGLYSDPQSCSSRCSSQRSSNSSLSSHFHRQSTQSRASKNYSSQRGPSIAQVAEVPKTSEQTNFGERQSSIRVENGGFRARDTYSVTPIVEGNEPLQYKAPPPQNSLQVLAGVQTDQRQSAANQYEQEQQPNPAYDYRQANKEEDDQAAAWSTQIEQQAEAVYASPQITLDTMSMQSASIVNQGAQQQQEQQLSGGSGAGEAEQAQYVSMLNNQPVTIHTELGQTAAPTYELMAPMDQFLQQTNQEVQQAQEQADQYEQQLSHLNSMAMHTSIEQAEPMHMIWNSMADSFDGRLIQTNEILGGQNQPQRINQIPLTSQGNHMLGPSMVHCMQCSSHKCSQPIFQPHHQQQQAHHQQQQPHHQQHHLQQQQNQHQQHQQQQHQAYHQTLNCSEISDMNLSSLAVEGDLDEEQLLEYLAGCDQDAQMYNNIQQQQHHNQQQQHQHQTSGYSQFGNIYR